MTPHEATRTLVKSPPEVWAQCSEAEALDRHLNGSFGEIRITRLEPETAVAWEGEQVSGTVRIEPSAWGTRVTLTAQVEEVEAAETVELAEPPPVPEAVVEPSPVPEPDPIIEPSPALEPERAAALPSPPEPPAEERPRGLWARLMRRLRAAPPPAQPEPQPEPEAEPEPIATSAPPEPEAPAAPPVAEEAPPEPTPEPTPSRPDPAEVLNAALDSLGQAHHRPFSRA